MKTNFGFGSMGFSCVRVLVRRTGVREGGVLVRAG